jgi:hypothetical protein
MTDTKEITIITLPGGDRYAKTRKLLERIYEMDTTKGKRKSKKRTTDVGYKNRNGQVVIRATNEKGTDFNSYIYVLRCTTCGHEYGANGTDIWQRRCPKHDAGKTGLKVPTTRNR